jgi:hypothetical protein
MSFFKKEDMVVERRMTKKQAPKAALSANPVPSFAPQPVVTFVFDNLKQLESACLKYRCVSDYVASHVVPVQRQTNSSANISVQ